MRKSIILALAASTFVASSAANAETIGGVDAFSFVAMGDMPYKLPDDYAKFDALIGAVNAMKPAFSIHLGDIKAGSTPCTDENFKKVFDQMAALNDPLVFTPGDNEWTDCHREKAGKFDPRERLAKVRQMFYPTPGKTLGKTPMDVTSQAVAMPEFSAFVENVRFERNGVVFGTVHVVGSNNGFEPVDPGAVEEFFARDKANLAWIDAVFKQATDTNAKAVVLAMQADVYDIRQAFPEMPRASAYTKTVQAIEKGAKAFNKPVLVIQGDSHELKYENFRGADGKIVPNTMRLVVMGEKYVHAVRVIVDPSAPGVFGIMPLIVQQNGEF
jgi:hypothetical protein